MFRSAPLKMTSLLNTTATLFKSSVKPPNSLLNSSKISHQLLSGLVRNYTSKKDEENEHKLIVNFLNPKDPTDNKFLQTLMDAEIIHFTRTQEHLHPTQAKMTEWLKIYVNSPDFLNTYHRSQRSLEFTAEATFWSVKLGLEPFLQKMTYAEIREFSPLAECFLMRGYTERAEFIKRVCEKLTKPSMSHEASFALQQAAWCVYVHFNSYERLQKEEELYKSSKSMTPKIR